MFYYDRTDVFQWTNVNKTGMSKDFFIYSYWYLLKKKFKFQ